MFIKNQSFTDRETLMEVLFDFELGEPAAVLQKIQSAIDEALRTDEEYQQELTKLEDEEDREAFADEIKQEFLANMLEEKFARFEVKDRKWYGIDSSGETILLAEFEAEL